MTEQTYFAQFSGESLDSERSWVIRTDDDLRQFNEYIERKCLERIQADMRKQREQKVNDDKR